MPDEDRPNNDGSADLLTEEDDVDTPIPVTTLFGAVGQFVAALLTVALLVALFIAGAIVVRWIFG